MKKMTQEWKVKDGDSIFLYLNGLDSFVGRPQRQLSTTLGSEQWMLPLVQQSSEAQALTFHKVPKPDSDVFVSADDEFFLEVENPGDPQSTFLRAALTQSPGFGPADRIVLSSKIGATAFSVSGSADSDRRVLFGESIYMVLGGPGSLRCLCSDIWDSWVAVRDQSPGQAFTQSWIVIPAGPLHTCNKDQHKCELVFPPPVPECTEGVKSDVSCKDSQGNYLYRTESQCKKRCESIYSFKCSGAPLFRCTIEPESGGLSSFDECQNQCGGPPPPPHEFLGSKLGSVVTIAISVGVIGFGIWMILQRSKR